MAKAPELEEQFYTADELISKPIKREKATTRFAKAGPNADHVQTKRIREIKETLQLTMPQLVSQLNKYERQFQSENFKGRTDAGQPSWLPMTVILLSSYMQGWVMQEPYMALTRKRLENFYKYKKSLPSAALNSRDICKIMDGWFAKLHIDPNSEEVSPWRQLARLIAPHYKRPVLASVAGAFELGEVSGDMRAFTITDQDGKIHEFWLDPKEPVLVKNKKQITVGEVIQYSVLMRSEKVNGEFVTTRLPSTDHTVFYRWYKNKKMPRSIETIELVDAAVNLAAKKIKD
jgi:hypothetical protein